MKRILVKTGLNSKELLVIVFLLLTFAAGLVIKLSGWKKPEEYDYSQADKNFDEKLKNNFEELKSNNQDSAAKLRADELLVLAESLGIDAEKNTGINKIKPGTIININTSGVQELMQLPGIGEVTAERIIEYREARLKFKSIEELQNVKGIGIKKFESLKNYVTVK